METFEKWQQVSSHTGRRSFCTNMYKRGLPTLMIMSISGHKTEKSFLKYIKVKQNEHAEMMKKAWENMYK
ncbi:MAG: tyrosine-type recombinase/integrase [Bacteroidetes bacterium]|nr:tyrosine-type recombinase/integrase [Bacteroidota bacterium]